MNQIEVERKNAFDRLAEIDQRLEEMRDEREGLLGELKLVLAMARDIDYYAKELLETFGGKT